MLRKKRCVDTGPEVFSGVYFVERLIRKLAKESFENVLNISLHIMVLIEYKNNNNNKTDAGTNIAALKE